MTKKNRYVVGINMPGYLPDNEPHVHNTYKEALLDLVNILEGETEDDDLSKEDHYELIEIRNRIQAVHDTWHPNKSDRDWGFTIGQYHYWLTINP